MKYAIISLVALMIVLQACKKTGTTIYSVDAGLKTAFDYKPGSYWIYKDSLTGAIDSAYVTANQQTFYLAGGCLLEPNEPKIELLSISLTVSDGNASDSEHWFFSMREKDFNIGFTNNNDKVESNVGFNLFTWPLAVSPAQNGSGCVPGLDSGAVTDIIPEVSLNGQAYGNAARSAHKPLTGRDTSMVYNDCFYVNQNAGIIKLVFDHPTTSVHRVLELQRYHIVR